MDPSYERRLLHNQHSPSPLTLSPGFSSDRCSDRFIPTRSTRTSWSQIGSDVGSGISKCYKEDETDNKREEVTYACLLKNELLGASIDDIKDSLNVDCNQNRGRALQISSKDSKNIFKYRYQSPSPRSRDSSPYLLSPVSEKSQKLLHSPRKHVRKISRFPYKVLDAPDLQDDFYLNLVDWSSQNLLGVGLASKVYLWNAATCEVVMCSDVSSIHLDSVTSVAFNERGNHLAIGTDQGHVHIWDVVTNQNISSRFVHTDRIGSLSWNGDVLATGSKDHSIALTDHRTSCPQPQNKLTGHRQEVCGLKWSPDHQHLASGSNDNKLMVWSLSNPNPLQTYVQHTAAVKAIAWSPHQHGLLASGGGTADRKIRFWNTLTGQGLQTIDTNSQVCTLAWSKHTNELVSTHGYALNEILLWRYPTMRQMARLTGHMYRVLYLALSPDGESIVTGAGDETLRFWNVFPKSRSMRVLKSPLNMFTKIR